MATEKKTGTIVPARKETLMIGGIPQDAVFFRHPGEPGGWMSNWFLSPFTLDGTDFSSMEQYIMVRKCRLFGDEALAAAVLRTDEPGEQRAIGRQVKLAFFESEADIDLFNTVCTIEAFEGNWMRVTAETRKGRTEKLIPVSSVFSIEFVPAKEA